MTKSRALPVQFLVEVAGVALVAAGFGWLVQFFLTYHYLPAPFVFDTFDTFMDWFHTAYWAHNAGAYSVWRSIYLPLSFVITGFFADPRCYSTSPFDARDCDSVALATILMTFAACVIATWMSFHRNDRKTAPMRTLAVAVGGPLLFGLERGNLILMAYLAFVLLYGRLVKKKAPVAAAAGFLINMKVYLLFPVVMLAIKRQWRLLELCGISAVAIYLVSLAIVGSGTPLELATNLQIWFSTFAISIWDQVVYSTTYTPYLLFDVLQYPIRDYIDQRTVDVIKVVIGYEVLLSRTFALFVVAAAWFYPKAVSLNRLVFFILMQSFLAQNPGGYAIPLIVFLVFMERRSNFAVGLALFCAYLVSIPMDYPLATVLQVERTSWIAGQTANVSYVLTLGALLRPLLFLLMLWSIGIDSLIDVHRAVKAGPPLLGLKPTRIAVSRLASA